MIRALVIALTVGASGCGPSYIILDVDADLMVPAEADSLHVVTLDPDDLTRELANVDFVLGETDAFPIEILLEPSTPTIVRIVLE